jgi:competence protein ComEA
MELTGPQRALVFIAIVCLLGGVTVVSWRSARSPVVSREMRYMPPDSLPPLSLAVHVAGEVQAPGLYWLPEGLRVQEAISRAGGFTTTADPSSVNLAAVISDGMQVKVARRKDAVSGPPSMSSEPVRPAPASAPAARTTVPLVSAPSPDPAAVNARAGSLPDTRPTLPISLNRATKDDLESIPEVGPALAARIMYYRYEHGGFRSVDELAQIEGIGPGRLANLRKYVTP